MSSNLPWYYLTMYHVIMYVWETRELMENDKRRDKREKKKSNISKEDK